MGRTSKRPPRKWALQDAKNRFSEVVDAAVRGEPQVVTRRGVDTAVIIAYDQYAAMTAESKPRLSLGAYLPGPASGSDREPFERIVLRNRTGI
jgi:prevent-host-death family protein